MELFVQLIIGLSWPIATVWIVYLLKGELQNLLRRLSNLKYKDIEAKFEHGLTKAEAQIITIEKTSPKSVTFNPEVNSVLEQLRRIAQASPRAAIMEAWILIESAAGKSGFVQGAAIPRINAPLFADWLVKNEKLPQGSVELIMELRKLRNQAAHIPDFALTYEEADRYLQLAAKLSNLILSPI